MGVLAQLGLAVPIFNLLGGGGGGGSQPKCRYVAQTAYFPTYDTVYKQVDNVDIQLFIEMQTIDW